MQVCSCSFDEERVHLAGGPCVDACGLRDTKEHECLFSNVFFEEGWNMTQTCRHKRLSPYDFLPGPDSYGSTCSAGSLAEADPATTPPHLGRLSQGLVYGHHLFIVEKTRNLARVENPVDVLQKGLVDELRIIQQEYRGPDGGCSKQRRRRRRSYSSPRVPYRNYLFLPSSKKLLV